MSGQEPDVLLHRQRGLSLILDTAQLSSQFLLHLYLATALRRGDKVVLLALAQPVEHYSYVARKMGLNWSSYIDSRALIVIPSAVVCSYLAAAAAAAAAAALATADGAPAASTAAATASNSACAASTSAAGAGASSAERVSTSPSSTTGLLQDLYTHIEAAASRSAPTTSTSPSSSAAAATPPTASAPTASTSAAVASGDDGVGNRPPNRPALLLIDSLSDLSAVAGGSPDWFTFLHYCRLLSSNPEDPCSMVAVAHRDVDVDRRWIAYLESLAEVVVHVEALAGRVGDVSGQVLIHRRAPPTLDNSAAAHMYTSSMARDVAPLSSWFFTSSESGTRWMSAVSGRNLL